jgi:DNA-binding transcriptional ArsR family regulator
MLPINKTEAKIIDYLYDADENALFGPYAIEIAKDLKIPKRTAYDALGSLERKEIVIADVRGMMRFYKLASNWRKVAELERNL